MNWSTIKHHFSWDGSWRDIYVLGTDSSDWQSVWGYLRSLTPPCVLSYDGVETDMPEDVVSVFNDREKLSPLLTVRILNLTLHCHFFGYQEIEFDLDPREILSADDVRVIEGFMEELGSLTGKKVILTHENAQSEVIAYRLPQVGVVFWTPANTIV